MALLSIRVLLACCLLLTQSFSRAEEKQRDSCKDVSNQPAWVDEFHDACFKTRTDKLDHPKGWHHTCKVRMIHGKGDLIVSALTKMTKVDVDFGDGSPKEAPTEIKITTMLRSAGKKGVTLIQCHKDGSKIVEVVSAYNTTGADEPFANLMKFSLPTTALADCYKVKPLSEDPETQKIHVLEKSC